MKRMCGIALAAVLFGGIAVAQSGTVNSISNDPEQNQKLSGSMGTTSGTANDVTPGQDRDETLGNPGNAPISGQMSEQANRPDQGKQAQATSGSPAPNQSSSSANSTSRPRGRDRNDKTAGKASSSSSPQ